MIFNPFEYERRYRFAVMDPDLRKEPRYLGLESEPISWDVKYPGVDTFQARVVDVFVRIAELPEGKIYDVPLAQIIRADCKPCAHEQDACWDDEWGLCCQECRTPFVISCFHARITRVDGPRPAATGMVADGPSWELRYWDPRTRRWEFQRRYKNFQVAMQYAGTLTEEKLASSLPF